MCVYNIPMSARTKLQNFLNKHKFKKEQNDNRKPTHTRIPDKDRNIMGGSWYIVGDDLKTFQQLYHTHVIKNENPEYLTERQCDDNPNVGPILLDFDFRYTYDTTTRQHNDETITTIIGTYMAHIVKYFDLNDTSKSFPIYVFQKDRIHRLETPNKVVKDGIHILIGIKMNHNLQCCLREDVLNEISSHIDLPIINSWSDVLDFKVTSGGSNWQIHGSQKPGYQCYKLTHKFTSFYKEGDETIGLTHDSHLNYDKKFENFIKLSAQYDQNTEYESTKYADEKESEYVQRNQRNDLNSSANVRSQRNIVIINSKDEIYDLHNITTVEQIKDINNKFIESLDDLRTQDHTILEAHKYTMILPKEYSDDYTMWLECGWALRNTDSRLFLTWMQFSANSSKFSCCDIMKYHNDWKGFDTGPRCLSYKTITFWARNYWNKRCRDNPKDPNHPNYVVNEYNELQNSSIDYYIGKAIDSQGSDYDIGMVLYYYYKNEYVNINFDNKTGWYHFNKHRWEKVVGCADLLVSLSSIIYDLFVGRIVNKVDIYEQVNYNDFDKNDNNVSNEQSRRAASITEVLKRVKSHTSKAHIASESKCLFYDKYFTQQENSNDYLLCFENGVFDFNKNVFRDGYPEDYITKSTKIDYIPYEELDTPKYAQHKQDIETFMEQLYPVKELNKYMWEVLASCCIAGNMNQKFYMFVGKGSNGKSLLVSLMRKCFGEYFGELPEQYLTQKRGAIGGATPEIMRLKGTRVAVVNEPSKDARINDGVMKEFTGGTDQITARRLYGDAESFTPKCKPIVCTNNLYDIQTNDNGTWRRIDKVDHMATFDDNPDPKNPYHFKKDPTLDESKIRSGLWPPIFMSMLVEIAVKTKGIVVPCDIVKVSSNDYRKNQDPILQFVNERITKAEGFRVKKQELVQEFQGWYKSNGFAGTGPKRNEIFDRLDSMFGKYKTSKPVGWANIKIVYEEDEEEEVACELRG
jgi:P4 family phage/plasmid primase-like protien